METTFVFETLFFTRLLKLTRLQVCDWQRPIRSARFYFLQRGTRIRRRARNERADKPTRALARSPRCVRTSPFLPSVKDLRRILSSFRSQRLERDAETRARARARGERRPGSRDRGIHYRSRTKRKNSRRIRAAPSPPPPLRTLTNPYSREPFAVSRFTFRVVRRARGARVLDVAQHCLLRRSFTAGPTRSRRRVRRRDPILYSRSYRKDPEAAHRAAAAIRPSLG